eukprot:7727213-Alexandrium_andersonii.AAC.1
MSASLVGSEMCIRDRPHHPHPTLHLLPAGDSNNGTNPASSTTTEQKLVPVSYTHLTLPTICSV